jgi:hypothetical protein
LKGSVVVIWRDILWVLDGILDGILDDFMGYFKCLI